MTLPRTSIRQEDRRTAPSIQVQVPRNWSPIPALLIPKETGQPGIFALFALIAQLP